MTMLDDDRLSSLLGTAGAAFEVPESGPDDILARALGSPSDALAGADDGKDDEAGDRGDGTGPGGTAPAPGLRPHRARRVVAGARRHRLLSVAACVVVLLLVAGTIGALVSGPTARPPITTAFSPRAAPMRRPTRSRPRSPRRRPVPASPPAGRLPRPSRPTRRTKRGLPVRPPRRRTPPLCPRELWASRRKSSRPAPWA